MICVFAQPGLNGKLFGFFQAPLVEFVTGENAEDTEGIFYTWPHADAGRILEIPGGDGDFFNAIFFGRELYDDFRIKNKIV